MLHGLLSGRGAWGPLRRELAPNFETIAPDLLGYGRSPHPGPDYTLDVVVEHLLPLVERERPEYVVGHSMGSIVALALAARLPESFRAIGLVGLPVYRDRADGLEYLHRRGFAHRAFLHTDEIAHAGCMAMHRLRGAWLPFAPALFPRQPREVLRTAFDHCRDSHLGSLSHIIFADLVESLADSVRTPVVALHGARDGAAPIDRMRALAAREGWTLKVSPTGNHQIVVERPALTARWIRDHLLPAGEP